MQGYNPHLTRVGRLRRLDLIARVLITRGAGAPGYKDQMAFTITTMSRERLITILLEATP